MGRLEFNPDGTPKGHEIHSPKPIDFSKTLVLNYNNENFGDSVDCKFIINIPEILTEEKIQLIGEWVDERIKTNSFSTSISLDKINPNKFVLSISGIGKDNRCRWCKAFRTALKTFCEKEGLLFRQINYCIFEE